MWVGQPNPIQPNPTLHYDRPVIDYESLRFVNKTTFTSTVAPIIVRILAANQIEIYGLARQKPKNQIWKQ